MRRFAVALIVSLCACGGPPLLAGAPSPDPAVVAAIAAGIAAGATIANPAAAGKRPESGRVSESEAAHGRRETVPPDVLDRLDEAQRDAGP